jgi:hypothetical protein
MDDAASVDEILGRMPDDDSIFTKNGDLRKGKVVISLERQHLRDTLWEPIRFALHTHLHHSEKGEARYLAQVCGVNAAQIHRYCYDQQVPDFEVGYTILRYLNRQKCCDPIPIPK